jgi:sialate O-acetylesterase
MKGYNVYLTPSWGVNSPTAQQLIDYINKAKEKGTIAIIMFHSVGGGYLNTGAEEHRQLVEYIKANKKDFYCATFKEVMEYVKKNNK